MGQQITDGNGMIADGIIESEEGCLEEGGDWDENNEACYIGFIGEVPVGKTYKEVHVDGKAITKGDVATFDDPDAGMHAGREDVITTLMAGEVEKIYKRDRGPELGTSMPLGRIDANDRYTEVSGEGSIIDPNSGTQSIAEDFLSEREDDPDVSAVIYERSMNDDGFDREVRR